jgi:LysM repeat protein
MSPTWRLKQIATIGILGLALVLPSFADAEAAPRRHRVRSKTATTSRAPGPVFHRVRRGETLVTIARKYRVSVQALRSANRIRSDRLRVGKKLAIPGRAPVPSRSAVQRRPVVPLVVAPPPPPVITVVQVIPELIVGSEVLAPKPMRVRRGPKDFYPVLAIVASETPLRLLGEEGGWYEVQLPTGEVGYLFVDDFNVEVQLEGPSQVPAPVPETVKAVDIVREAMRYIGIRYVWGGESARGMDCSGFIYLVFQARLPGLERMRSHQYYRMGAPIDTASLVPGDLVFFSTYMRGPSHVGIYIGDGKFIHASSGYGVVTITPLDDPYYAARFVGARRLVKP